MLRLTLLACLQPPSYPPRAEAGIFWSSSNLPRAEPGLDGASPSLLTGKIKPRVMLILVIEHHRDDALVQPCLLVRRSSSPARPPPFSLHASTCC